MRGPKPIALHESAAIALCRLAFIGLGLVPVFACASWALVTWTPFYAARQATHWETSISANLGLDVRIGDVTDESPWRTRINDITLLHPETGETIAQAETIWLSRTEDNWLIQTPHASVNHPELGTLARNIHDWILCRPRQFQQKVVIAAESVELLQTAFGITDFRLTSLPDESTRRMLMRFSLPDANYPNGATAQEEATPIELFVRREQSEGGLQTGLRLNTGANWLPVQFFPPQLTMAERLGESARLRGQVDWVDSQAGWTLTVGGKDDESKGYSSFVTVDNLDFTRLTANTPCRLHGIGSLTIGATITDAAIVDTHGHVFVDRDVKHIGGLFAREACRFLGLNDNGTLAASSRADFPFEQLSLAFGMSHGNLYLAPGGQDATVLMGRNAPLVQRNPQDWQHPIPLVQVTRLLRHLEEAPELQTPFGSTVLLSDYLLMKLPQIRKTAQAHESGNRRLASDQRQLH